MKKIILFLFIGIIGFTLAACSEDDGNQGSDSTSEDSQDAGKNNDEEKQSEMMEVNVGTNPTFPPFETKEGGELKGFDIALIKAIADEENMEVHFNSLSFDGLVPSLQTSEIDAAIAGMSISEERLENADFSNAYYKSGLSVVTNSDTDIEDFDDLEEKIVGTQKGTTSVKYMKDHNISSSNIKQYDDITSAYNALENGGVDAVLYDHPVNVNYIKEHETEAEVVGDLLTGEYYGIAVSKDESDLVKKFNDGLKKLRENGRYEELFDEFLAGDKRGVVDKDLPPEDALK